MDERVIDLLRLNVPKARIADDLGIHRVQLLRRLEKLNVSPAVLAAKPEGPAPTSHLQEYKRVRRGFHVPADVEPAYYDLLRQGVSIDEARRRLNIKKDREK